VPARADAGPVLLVSVMLSFGLSRLAEAIAYPVKRFDHVAGFVNRLELLAQALAVAVDRAVVDIDLLVIGGGHQRAAALHHARALRQRMQDKELGHRQRDRLALPGAGVAVLIHDKLAPLERTGWLARRLGVDVPSACPAQHGTHAFNQQALRERLTD